MYSVVFRFIISIHKIEYYGNIYVKFYKSIKGYVVGSAVTFTSLFYSTQWNMYCVYLLSEINTLKTIETFSRVSFEVNGCFSCLCVNLLKKLCDLRR